MPDSSLQHRIAALHKSPWRGVVAVTGGGSLIISQLLTEPGASNTVLECLVPYAQKSLEHFLRMTPEQACSATTARRMAMNAFQRALQLAERDSAHLFGVACSASLASRVAKKGEHRFHIALQTRDLTYSFNLTLLKGARNRAHEEVLTAEQILQTLEVASAGKQARPLLLPQEQADIEAITAPESWRRVVMDGERARCIRGAGETPPRVIFPGSFNPVHSGHRTMAALARQMLSQPVAFELCANNFDKAPLDYHDIHERLRNFSDDESVWLTGAASFAAKAEIFPRATFVVGVDTMRRIGQTRYYGGPGELQAAIRTLTDRECRFLVFGRVDEQDRFVGLTDLDLPHELGLLCDGVNQSRFRMDISSTALRRQQQPGDSNDD